MVKSFELRSIWSRPQTPSNSGKSEHDVWKNSMKNIARIAYAVPVTLYSRVTVNVEIIVLNCQKCNQCLKGLKFFDGVLQLSLSLSLPLSFCWSGHVSYNSDQKSQRSQSL